MAGQWRSGGAGGDPRRAGRCPKQTFLSFIRLFSALFTPVKLRSFTKHKIIDFIPRGSLRFAALFLPLISFPIPHLSSCSKHNRLEAFTSENSNFIAHYLTMSHRFLTWSLIILCMWVRLHLPISKSPKFTSASYSKWLHVQLTHLASSTVSRSSRMCGAYQMNSLPPSCLSLVAQTLDVPPSWYLLWATIHKTRVWLLLERLS